MYILEKNRGNPIIKQQITLQNYMSCFFDEKLSELKIIRYIRKQKSQRFTKKLTINHFVAVSDTYRDDISDGYSILG